jgi:cytochrome c553
MATLLCLPASLLAQAPSFSRDVAPIFTEHCLSCHGPAQQLSQYDLSVRATALQGGQKGTAILPGDAANSALVRRVSGALQPSMPLGGKLSDADMATLKQWIDAGAPWEGGALGSAKASPPPPQQHLEEKEFSEKDRNWWAFQKAARHPVPQAGDPRWNDNPVDGFVKRALEQQGLEPAPPTDRRTLIRRAYLDMVGLLPPYEVVEEFVYDRAPDAWEKQVDRLLASPHYGERWARHWLDVARYADSWGHIHDDDNPNAWRYRDYVIRAFNDDKPYDQFVREQMAGDELANVTYDSLIATSFHRIGPRVLFREKQNPHYRYDYLNDMIATTSGAFLGLTVACARCHDHKFDAISQMDYFRMAAVFFPFIDYDHPLTPSDEAVAYEARRAEIEAQIEPLQKQADTILEPYQQARFEEQLKKFPLDVQQAVKTPAQERTAGQKLLAEQVLSVRDGGRRGLKLSEADREKVDSIQEQVRELRKGLPDALPVAAGIRDGDYRFTPDGPGDTPVPGTTAKRIEVDFDGSFVPRPDKLYEPPPLYYPPLGKPGEGQLIEAGFLSVLSGGDAAAILAPEGKLSSGRRLALADWLVSDDNPLTARVMVNRIWQHHFGRGIVRSASNFGRMGSLPTHPELLDWLASEFVRQGWRIKPIHRLILTSQAYQMDGSFYRAGNFEKDPDNKYLWRFPMQRVEAEIVRDLILSASGQLNLAAGGPPFFPALAASVHDEVKRVGRWELTREEPSNWRRSIYSYWKRARKHPMFEVFDQPDTMVSCEQRTTTTVPTQALTLLNNEFSLLQSRHFAVRVREAAGESVESQLRTAYHIALSRDPLPAEMADNLAFLAERRAHHASKPAENPALAALTDLCNVVLNLNEFLYVQ